MKKTLIALAVSSASLVSMSAFAVDYDGKALAENGNLYKNENTSVNVSGEMDAFLNQSSGQDMDLDLWAKVQMDIQHKLNNGMSVFGSFEVESANSYEVDMLGLPQIESESGMVLDDAYIGFGFTDNFGIAMGETGDFGDSMDALVIDNTNEGFGYHDDYVDGYETDGHTLAAKYNIAGLTLIGDINFDQTDDSDLGYGISAKYDILQTGLFVGGVYQAQGAADFDVYGATVGYGNDMFNLAMNYSITTDSAIGGFDGTANDDIDQIGFAADFKFMQKARVYTTGGFASDDDNDMFFYTVGADYALTDNVLAFVEYSSNDAAEDLYDGDTNQFAMLGMYYMF